MNGMPNDRNRGLVKSIAARSQVRIWCNHQEYVFSKRFHTAYFQWHGEINVI